MKLFPATSFWGVWFVIFDGARVILLHWLQIPWSQRLGLSQRAGSSVHGPVETAIKLVVLQ